MNIHKDDLKSNFFFGNWIYYRAIVEMHGRCVWWCGNGLFLKGNRGSRMGLETGAQKYQGATALVGWQKARSLGKMLFQGAL